MVIDEDEDKYEHLAGTINKLLGSVSVRKKLLRLLYSFGFVNALIWICSLLFPADVSDAFGMVQETSDKLSKIVLALPFFLGMAIDQHLKTKKAQPPLSGPVFNILRTVS